MTRRERPIHAFRRRLLQLIDEHFDGRYTVLAHRAGIPVSTMQHYIHAAKRLPGGEQVMRLAVALGVTAQYLITGREGVRPPGPPTPPATAPRQPTPRREPATHVSLPMFRCGCPGSCTLTEGVLAVAAAHARAVVPIAMLAHYEDHWFMAVDVTPELPCPVRGVATGHPARRRLGRPGTPLGALTLLHDAGRCRLGFVTPHEDRLVFTSAPGTAPEVLSPTGRIQGTIVAAVTAV